MKTTRQVKEMTDREIQEATLNNLRHINESTKVIEGILIACLIITIIAGLLIIANPL